MLGDSESPTMSLRERKKIETWEAIHRAAAEQALENGLEQATIEKITTEVGISRRTFFNYFPSKEDAILGVKNPFLDPVLVENFFDHDDVLGRTATLLITVARTAYSTGEKPLRRQLFHRFPSLLQRRRELTLQGEEIVAEALSQKMRQHRKWEHGMGSHSVEEVARMLVYAAGVPLRYTASLEDGLGADGFDLGLLNESSDFYQELYGKIV